MQSSTILIVDDSRDSLELIKRFLNIGGYTDLLEAESGSEALQFFADSEKNSGTHGRDKASVDLVLLDVVMPGMDGIEVCALLKAVPAMRDVPVIMVTVDTKDNILQQAFAKGAVDFIRKPINKVELLSRVQSALLLKFEMDRRLLLTSQLEEANKKLTLLSVRDGLTGIANRRHFDEFLDQEWRRCLREQKSLSLCMVDIDFFKLYNDTYGHLTGDDCLKKVAVSLTTVARRPGDLVARYGGEEFAIVLSATSPQGARLVADNAVEKIRSEQIPHCRSQVADYVTVSIGVASLFPQKNKTTLSNLIKDADKALYMAKNEGRNRVIVCQGNQQ